MGGSLFRAGVAEALGVFIFVFAGGAAICMDRYMSSPGIGDEGMGITGIALAHGLALMVAVYVTAARSGAHLNPAVTLGLLIIGKVKGGQAGLYILMQFLGAVAAGIATWAMFPAYRELGPRLGLPSYIDNPSLPGAMGMTKAIGIEMLLTFVLMTVILNTAFDAARAARQMFGICIGLTVTFCIFMGASYTGAAMNPARYFGPAAVSGSLSQLGTYFIGPILGAIAAAVFYKLFMETKEAETVQTA